MIQLKTLLFALTAAVLVTVASAGTDAGKDSAKYYKTNPEDWDSKKISVDCVAVTRINAATAVDGIVFLVAHTIDNKNQVSGGNIVVAVLEDDLESFVHKYGTVPERNAGNTEGLKSKRLRAEFHQLKGGRVYLDGSGEAQELILTQLETAIDVIRLGDRIPEVGANFGIGNGQDNRADNGPWNGNGRSQMHR